MFLSFHIGKCCGMKTIWGMGCKPVSYEDGGNKKEYLLGKLGALEKPMKHDKVGAGVESHTRFYHHAAPMETRLQRLDRYLNFVKDERPNNIIEIILAESINHYSNQMEWVPELEKRGFKFVNKCKNSNSGNTIHVYHLNVGEDNGVS
jgi:hypothetical protein